MLDLLKSLNAHNLPFFQLNLVILVSKFMVRRALPELTYLLLGLLSPLRHFLLNKNAFQRLKITHYPSIICRNNSV